jgi:hypothetical protein
MFLWRLNVGNSSLTGAQLLSELLYSLPQEPILRILGIMFGSGRRQIPSKFYEAGNLGQRQSLSKVS